MPHAVTHIILTLVIAELIRDHWFKKKKLPLHYVLIAGIAGLLPDIDVIVYWILKLFSNVQLGDVHRMFTHTVFFLLLFIILGLLTTNVKWKFLSKHKLKLNYVFYFVALGVGIHLILDGIVLGYIMPFYPFSHFTLGLNLLAISYFEGTILPALDAIILVLWLIHEEAVHKISRFL